MSLEHRRAAPLVGIAWDFPGCEAMGVSSRFGYTAGLSAGTFVPVPSRTVMSMIKRTTQRIRYLRTADGVQARLGRGGFGPVLVKAANWLTHLEYEWESPVWRHWIRFFSDHFRFIRYDERGCGMTDWNVGDLSFDRWVEDLEAVVAAADPQEPFALLGISQGAADLRRLRREASGARLTSHPLRRLCPRAVSPRRSRQGALVPGDDRSRSSRMGQ